MILSVKYEILRSIDLKVIYDDNTFKRVEVAPNDVVQIAYNKNGMRKDVKGRVSAIDTDPHWSPRNPHYVYRGDCCHKHPEEACFIILDCSDAGVADIEKINVHDIIDCEMIQKYNDSLAVMSPKGDDRITNIRVHENVLQISSDFGATWVDAKDVLGLA